jgi:hypothetical protein
MKWYTLSLPINDISSDVSKQLGTIKRAILSNPSFNATEENIRYFPHLRVLATLCNDGLEDAIRALPDVKQVTIPSPKGFSRDTRWYINLISGWEYILENASKYEAGVISMSLTPPNRGMTVDFNEPVIRATSLAWQRGVIPVIAAGNWGRERGEDTLNPWVKSEFNISVGAADKKGVRVSDYSSRGKYNEHYRPTVVSVEEQNPPTGNVGTSFAAPAIADIVLLFEAFLLTIWKLGQRPINQLPNFIPSAVRKMLESAARVIPGGAHERGAGFVDAAIALQWLQNIQLSKIVSLLPQLSWIRLGWLEAAKEELSDNRKLVSKHRLVRFTIDVDYDWEEPMFVPGLCRLAKDNFFLFRQFAEHRATQDTNIALYPAHNAEFIEISIEPVQQRGRQIVVDKYNKGDVTTIQEGISKAQPFDEVIVRPGIYDEEVVLHSRIILRGYPNTVLRHASGIPLTCNECRNTQVSGLTIISEGARRPAISLTDTTSVGFLNCIITSRSGNAVDALASRRLMFDDCSLSGGINAMFCGLTSELRLQNVRAQGEQTCLLIYGGSGIIVESSIEGLQNEAILFFQPNIKWTSSDQVTVFFYPWGEQYIYNTREIIPGAVASMDSVGALARILFQFSIRDTNLSAGRVGIAVLNTDLVQVIGGSLKGKVADYALIEAETPNHLFDPSQMDKLSLLMHIRRHFEQMRLRL